jgi:hypothetical protein
MANQNCLRNIDPGACLIELTPFSLWEKGGDEGAKPDGELSPLPNPLPKGEGVRIHFIKERN